MKKPFLKKAWKWFRVVLVIYVLLGVALYFLQEKFLFHPEKLSIDYEYAFPIPFNEINLPVTGEKNLNIIQFLVTDTLRKGVVLYFHGNRRHILRYALFATDFTKKGYEVWMMDYPGFGKSTGERTEEIIYQDAQRVYQIALKNFSPDSMIIYGKSFGTGIASYLASRNSCRRLILETPYYNMDALARRYFFIYPVGALLKYSLPNNEYLERVDAPVSIFHGTRDGVIPYKHAKQLVKIKPGTELITIEGGRHNNLSEFPLYHEKLDSLLALK